MPRSSRPSRRALPASSRRVRRAGLALALAGSLALSACQDLPGGVAARVNGEDISDEFLGAIVAAERDRVLGAGASSADANALLAGYQRESLSQVIVQRLLEQEAAERGIGLTAEEAEAAWQEQVDLAGGIEALRVRLDELGLTEDEARRQVARNVLIGRLQDDVRATIVVDEAEVRGVYDARAAQWDVRRISHLAVATEEEAAEALALIESGEATFEELAEERSLDTSTGPVGGGLGENPRGTFPAPFDDAAWEAEVGAVVGPVQTSFGWHLLRVDEARTIPFDEVAERIEEELRGQRFQEEYSALLTALVAESDIEVDGRFGEWDGFSGEVVPIDVFARR